MVSCFLCCRCFGSLLFTTCVLLGSFVIYINLLFIDQKKEKKNPSVRIEDESAPLREVQFHLEQQVIRK